MDLLNQAYLLVAERYRTLTPGSRLTAVLLAAVALASVGYLITHQSSETMVDLMRGESISVAQLQVMEAALGEAKLKDYQVQGRSIRVPSGRENEFMAALSKAKAMPRTLGAAQREAADSGSWYDDYQRDQQRMKIGKQDDLALVICKMRGIESASVQLDADKPGGFREKVVTAAVWIKPCDAERLDENMVLAIRHSVAGAVAGLKPENVTVTDLNGPQTWHGTMTAPAAGDPFHALKQAREQDLKTKITGALATIPNVTVALNLEWDRNRADPIEQPGIEPKLRAARVSIGVPASYFKRILKAAEAGRSARSDLETDPAAMKRYHDEESAKIQKHVAQLLPPADGIADSASLVAVTTFPDVSEHESPETASGWAFWKNLDRSWGLAAAAGLAFVSLLALWSMVRAPGAAPTVPAAGESAEAASARVPPPHARRRLSPGDASAREELSALVENDPETAVNVLRTWIGQGV